MNIKFPERPVANGDAEPAENGVSDAESPRGTSDIIVITGKKEDAEKANEELLVCSIFVTPLKLLCHSSLLIKIRLLMLSLQSIVMPWACEYQLYPA